MMLLLAGLTGHTASSDSKSSSGKGSAVAGAGSSPNCRALQKYRSAQPAAGAEATATEVSEVSV